MLLRLMQNTRKELADAGAEMMLCVMMLPLVVVGCTSKRLSVSVREATTASGVDNAASSDWQTPLNGIISPQREVDHYAKQLKEPRKYINEREIERPYRWATHELL